VIGEFAWMISDIRAVAPGGASSPQTRSKPYTRTVKNRQHETPTFLRSVQHARCFCCTPAKWYDASKPRNKVACWVALDADIDNILVPIQADGGVDYS